ncbi:mechanosensitive ion channel family protein [Candidatus Woesearchaeota archaeon]|nr:mechanosensitive ion channel family protein [Candidatus Woesearchaeota archaeon]
MAFVGDVSFERFVLFFLLIVCTIILGNGIGAYLKKHFKLKEQRSWFFLALPKVIMYGIYFFGFYYGVDKIIAFDIQAFAAAFGIIGVVVAFSSQHIMQNVVAGIMIFADRSIKEGDYVEFGGSLCKVVDVSIRKTKLRSKDGRVIAVPNSQFITGTITNYSKGEFYRIDISIAIDPGADIEKAKSVLYGIAVEHKDIVPKTQPRKKSILQVMLEVPPDMKKFEPKIFVKEITKLKTVIELWCWINEFRSKERIVSEVLEQAKKKLSEADIQLG